MALITEQILSETETELTIRFTRNSGKYQDKTVPKIEGKTNEQMLEIWHRRMTVHILKNRIRPNTWTAAAE